MNERRLQRLLLMNHSNVAGKHRLTASVGGPCFIGQGQAPGGRGPPQAIGATGDALSAVQLETRSAREGQVVSRPVHGNLSGAVRGVGHGRGGAGGLSL